MVIKTTIEIGMDIQELTLPSDEASPKLAPDTEWLCEKILKDRLAHVDVKYLRKIEPITAVTLDAFFKGLKDIGKD